MIRIICLGKITENYLKLGIEDYLKRINKYIKIEIIELQDESFNEEKKNLIKEKEKILKIIKNNDYNIILDLNGKRINSIDFSNEIEEAFIKSKGNINFIIGGSNGLHEEIKTIGTKMFSFSNLTFPHQLFRLILLEQIYRSLKIINNEKYHK